MMLAGALGRSPSGGEAVLCGGEVVGEPDLFGLVLLVLLDPAVELGPSSLEVPGVAVAVQARATIPAGVEVENPGRDIGEEDAVSLIVDGFCKQVFKELPMEFAVEAKKLLEVSLEGAVG